MFPFYTAKVDVAEAGRTVLKAAEAALPMTNSHDALRGHLRTALMAAHGVTNTYDSQGPWINDVFPKHVVYQHNGQTLKRSYTATQGAAGTDPSVTVGEPKKVHVAYVSSAAEKESMRVLLGSPDGLVEDTDWYSSLGAKESVIITVPGSEIKVRESVQFLEPTAVDGVVVKEAKGGKATVPVCIIKPGWGSCAFYSKDMIKESGPKAFKKNTQMFINHATEAEEAARPEGDVDLLASVLSKDAYWDENGPVGPALYSEALVFPDHEATIMNKGPYIGCSINAGITATPGVAEGKNGLIAESFTRAYSIDYVTKAGAGGAPIVNVTESARGGAPSLEVKEKEMAVLTDAEVQALRDELAKSQAQNKAHESQMNKILAVATVGMLVQEAGFTIKQSLLERICESPKMTDGKVDSAWAKEAAADLLSVAESAGRVEGLGEGRLTVHEGNRNKAQDEAEDKDLMASLRTLGVSEAGLKYAMGGK